MKTGLLSDKIGLTKKLGWKRAGFVDRWKEAGMGKAILTFICMFLSLAFGFDSYASEHLLPLEESEYQEIVSGLPRDPISRSSRIQCRWNPRVYHSSSESHGTCIYRRVADGGRKQEYSTIFGGTGWAFPIKREALEPGTYRLLYWELPEFHHSRCHKK